ncbi:hemerythrin domain-containing protein [Micromonospora sagamiensis]|uniref:Hemerythrin HHE cation binding domain-containing protein n=1 Tax=Micromonospora sagamiensis TaxID=47875 RepID=A0A562WHS5_9ACTN|nr:hemerythrin domain-containing protein [Micromonospora sagamiensis]TWJ29816.1 hemerythrin HHE cation binding domain-containing protein [Micromonospora sagamiensis]BCL17155.1 hemerythrin [Micromonospora sagamiensis]
MSVPLPPLPPAEGDEGYRPGGRSVVDVVDEEHRRLTALVEELADPATDADRRRAVADVFTAEVSRHLSGEEQYLYPALRGALPDGAELADRDVETDTALRRAVRAADPEHAADVRRRWRQHVAAVEPALGRLRGVATEEELIRLGNRFAIAEEAAPTRPHSGTPTAPPWNRIVEPAVGVVDKIRDAVTGRPTYPADLDRD